MQRLWGLDPSRGVQWWLGSPSDRGTRALAMASSCATRRRQVHPVNNEMTKKHGYWRYGVFGSGGTLAGLGLGWLNYRPGST